MNALERTIDRLFSSSSGSHAYMLADRVVRDMRKIRYLTIDVSKDEVEMPLVAFHDFSDIARRSQAGGTNLPDEIVVALRAGKRKAAYKSIESQLREVLICDVRDDNLVAIKVEGCQEPYYGAKGLLFDPHFHPIFLCTWKMEKVECEGGKKLRQKKAMIYIDKDCFIRKGNAVERFISGKFPTTALGCFLPTERYRGFIPCNQDIGPEVIIGKIPFDFRPIVSPSINTTNEELIAVALNNIDEIA